MKPLILFSITAAALVILASCTQRQSDGSKKDGPFLEISFTKKTEEADLSLLQSLIGSGSGDAETFGEGADLLLFFEEEDCSTCSRVKPIVEEWIGLTGAKVYAYHEDYGTDAEPRKEMLKKLGSSDGINLTAGRLIAFLNGKNAGSIAGTFDLESAEKIDAFVKRHFSYIPLGEYKASSLKDIDSLYALRKTADSREDCLFYFERLSCPDCRALANPSKTDAISFLVKNSDKGICRITTEKILEDLEKKITVDGTEYSSLLDYLDIMCIENENWNAEKSAKKKTEYIEMITVSKEVDSFPDSDEEYAKALAEYICASATKDQCFRLSDRNVPSFMLSKNDSDNLQKAEVLEKAYRESGFDEANYLHRLLFCNYFSADNSVLAKELYQEYLIDWMKN